MEKTDYGETLELPNLADVDLPRERKRFTQSPPEGHPVIAIGASRLTSKAGQDYLSVNLVGIHGECEGAMEAFGINAWHSDPSVSGFALSKLKLLYKLVGVPDDHKLGEVFYKPFHVEVLPPQNKYTQWGKLLPCPSGSRYPSERQLREKYPPSAPSPSRAREGGDNTSVSEVRQQRNESGGAVKFPDELPF